MSTGVEKVLADAKARDSAEGAAASGNASAKAPCEPEVVEPTTETPDNAWGSPEPSECHTATVTGLDAPKIPIDDAKTAKEQLDAEHQENRVWVPTLSDLHPPTPFTDKQPILRGREEWSKRKRIYSDEYRHYQLAVEQINRLIAEVGLNLKLGLSQSTETWIITITHFKGGQGKSPLTAALATALGSATGIPVLVVDANPDMGGAAALLGIPEKHTPYISQLAAEIKAMSTAEVVRSMMATDDNVRVAAGDPAQRGKRFDVDLFESLIKELKSHFGIILLDCGTGVSGDVGFKAIEMSNSVVLPMLTTKGPYELNGSVQGCEYTHNFLIGEDVVNDASAPDSYRQKIENSVTVALGLQPDESIDPFLEQLTRPEWVRARVPFDKLMNAKRFPARLVPPLDHRVPEPWRGNNGDTTAINPVTQYYLLKLAELCMQSSVSNQPSAQEGHETPREEE